MTDNDPQLQVLRERLCARVDFKKFSASPTSRPHLERVDRSDITALTQTLYRYGDCIPFAKALTKRFELEAMVICRSLSESPSEPE